MAHHRSNLIGGKYHAEGTKFYVRATKAGAENLFKKIVKDYFDPEENTEEELEKACDLWFWESKHGLVVTYTKCTAVADECYFSILAYFLFGSIMEIYDAIYFIFCGNCFNVLWYI